MQMTFNRTLSERVEEVTQKQAKAAARARAARAARERDAAMALWEKQFEERWGVKPVNVAKLTPTLTGGECPKKTYRGVSEKYSQLVIKKGKLVEQIFRRGSGNHTAFVDQLTFVVDKKTCANLFDDVKLQSDVDYVQNLNLWLFSIFGFGVSHDRKKSANFYSASYNLGDYENSYGVVCIGGGLNESNENTICVEITATGLNAAEEGWEERLYNWSMMKEVVDFRYTRVDLARDYLGGELSVEHVLEMYRNDGFTCSVQRPKLRLEGDDWYNDTKNGRTVYIGSRMSSKMLRAYEKGKQLGLKDSPWLRLECELRNRDLIIPKDIVLAPGDYMSTQYPCLYELFKTDTPKRAVIKERIVQRTVEHVVKYLRMQGSKAVNMLKELGKTNEEILSVFDEDAGVPKDMNPGQYFCQLLKIDFITHKLYQPTEDEAFEPSPVH
ncbi:MAG: replication initiation factor domain-containing protein [Neisseria zoodegmatis]|uniref:replication initiation factor domain-containing protein n=1 Tax=Neisseria zoodegmatis TaxID=326523 RepID=UPI0026EE1630|nr:replication initiation factor domain-containing protein [Neisseria zoodegmatis]MDO5069957.1 replication initiation factor domain-containing protein [Neisseria zoodegmatis]